MTDFGPVAEAAHSGGSSPSFDLIVGLVVLGLTWVGFSKRTKDKKASFWIAVAITAICAVFILSGIWELLR
jgi:hypothetical protein